jgi:hypothetical protein
MTLPMPEDLRRRVIEANELLEVLERRASALESGTKAQIESMTLEVKQLRHDFNNMRMVINVLMAEIEARDPVENKPSKEGPSGKR